MPRPGEVSNDAQAFRQILGRLQDEVGKLLDFATRAQQQGAFGSSAPFWAFVRMMMPIAESLGDLVYRTDSTAANLFSVLANEFEAVHPGYRGKAAAIAVLYRHGLTHHDELRCLQTAGRELVWQISFNKPNDHLMITNDGGDRWLHFDLHAFYRDLIAVCQACLARSWGGAVKDRYNGWLVLDLDAARNNAGLRQAQQEILQL